MVSCTSHWFPFLSITELLDIKTLYHTSQQFIQIFSLRLLSSFTARGIVYVSLVSFRWHIEELLDIETVFPSLHESTVHTNIITTICRFCSRGVMYHSPHVFAFLVYYTLKSDHHHSFNEQLHARSHFITFGFLFFAVIMPCRHYFLSTVVIVHQIILLALHSQHVDVCILSLHYLWLHIFAVIMPCRPYFVSIVVIVH